MIIFAQHRLVDLQDHNLRGDSNQVFHILLKFGNNDPNKRMDNRERFHDWTIINLDHCSH
jgi:hypothetical protein